MAHNTITIRMDENLKKQLDKPFDNTRVEAKTAFFEMRRIAEENRLTDMSLDEINAEISAVRSEK